VTAETVDLMSPDRSRRQLLAGLAATGAAMLADPGRVLARLAAAQPCGDPAAAGPLIGTLPLFRGDAPVQPFGVKFGGPGLDARLVTDLSLLEPGRLITPNSLAYIRTESPSEAAKQQGPWVIRTSGLLAPDAPATLALDDLSTRARAMGAHLFECAGNNNPANFGLMSVAEWDGVPLTEIVQRLRPTSRATAVLVGGLDHDGQRSRDSVAGASWIFPLASLDRMGACLAFRMNGEPMPADHGKPVRLVVPGWYGCAWIKWVNEIRLVGPDEPATSQMQEFAGRTHQTARHDLARDFAPADIQTAAVPVRIEKRRAPAGLEYRIVGIVWGGTKPVDRLAIRFGPHDDWKPFSICPAPETHRVWSLWEYRWKPGTPGLYDIALRVPDATVPQRRLDRGYYVRQVRIDETALR
jgi:DMSO/TMAO reductase YedYZ molybdopterin-dependent catalytic subunit